MHNIIKVFPLRFPLLQGRKMGASSEVSSSSSKWKSTFSPISDPKPPSDFRQSSSSICVGMSRRGSTDSDSEQKQQRRLDRERTEHYGNTKPWDTFSKQKSLEWELKTAGGPASQNLFISAAAGGGLLSGKVSVPTTVSSTSGGQYFPLGGNSVLQSLFGVQSPSSATSGPSRLANGHSALGSFSSAGLAGGAAGGKFLLLFVTGLPVSSPEMYFVALLSCLAYLLVLSVLLNCIFLQES